MVTDLVVAVLCSGAKAGVHRGHFLVQQRRQDSTPFLEQTVDAGTSRTGCCLVVDVVGGRPEHHVAEHGWGNEHALGVRRRDGQECSGEQWPGQLVEHDELAPARSDGEPVETDRAMKFVAVQACRVHHETRPHLLTASSREGGDFRADIATHEVVVQQDGCSVLCRLVGKCKRRRPRVDDVLVGHDHPAGDSRTEMWLQGVGRVGVDDLGVLVTVDAGLGLQFGKPRGLLVVPRDQQCTGLLDGDTNRRCVVAEQRVAAGDEPGFERARGGIEPGVQDRRVGLARSGTDVGPGLDQGDERGRDGRAGGRRHTRRRRHRRRPRRTRSRRRRRCS